LAQLPPLEKLTITNACDMATAKSVPTSLTCFRPYSVRRDALPLLLERLPNLTRLKSNGEITEDHFDLLLRDQKQVYLESVWAVRLSRLERWLPYFTHEAIPTQTVQELMYTALQKAYPFFVGLTVDHIHATFDFLFLRNHWAPYWPSNLTVLKIGSCVLPDRFTRLLPRTLTVLDVIDMRGTSHRSTRHLPSSLTTLGISATGFNLLAYQQLPRGLTKLQLRHQRKFWPHHAKALPPALLSLTLDVLLTCNSMIAALPRAITELDFGYSARTVTGPALQFLPPNLLFLGGALLNVDNSAYQTVFSKIPTFSTYHRYVPGDYNIKYELLKSSLDINSFEQLASHLLLPSMEV
jgi:hypothetical protein